MFSPLTREDLVTWKAALEMKPDFTSDAACQAEKRVCDQDTFARIFNLGTFN